MMWNSQYQPGQEGFEHQVALNTRLMDAAKECNVEEMRNAINEGAEVNSQLLSSAYDPILIIVARANRNARDKGEAIEYLLEIGADVDAIDSYSNTAADYLEGEPDLFDLVQPNQLKPACG